MPEYAGYWLECHNRSCGFPIRVPYSAAGAKADRRLRAVSSFLFACPVCLQVNTYKMKDLRKVQFRTRDPYKAGKLVLYGTHLVCAHRGCTNQIVVFTAAAATISTAALSRLWKTWKVSLRCSQEHRFRIPDPKTWWIQEESGLGGEGFRDTDLSNI